MRKTLLETCLQLGENGAAGFVQYVLHSAEALQISVDQDSQLINMRHAFEAKSLALQHGLIRADTVLRESDRLRGPHLSPEELSGIRAFHECLRTALPSQNFLHSMRITSSEAFKHKLFGNGERAYLDIVGMRIVPVNHADFFDLLNYIEQLEATRMCMLNSFLFSVNDFHRLISPTSSSSYRAVHYLLEVRGVFIELQIRCIGVDTWSKMHQPTLYKPRIMVTEHQTQCIEKFGVIASQLDCHLLTCLSE